MILLLDNFRKTRLVWDKASQKVTEFIRAGSNDNHGRKLSVMVTDEGEVVDLSGLSLSLYWETADKSVKGLDALAPVNATEGKFEIYYTPELLSNVGHLRAHLVLVSVDGRVISEAFRISVFSGIDEGAIVGQASFTALTDALLNAQKLEENYAPRLNAVEINKADKTEVNNLTAQLAHKADQAFVDSQFSSIVSGAPKGTYASLSALQDAYPSGTDGIFLVLDTGHWYYWQSTTSEWMDGGVYQAGGGDWLEAMTTENEIWEVV